MGTTSKVAGVVQIDGTPAHRKVRAFGYSETTQMINGAAVILSKSLGHATSDPITGEYNINLLDDYEKEVFVVAFDDYGAAFTPGLTLTVGDRIHPTTPNGYVWETTGSGTLPDVEPAWLVDTETSQTYGTAVMIARPFYRPMVHGPVMPEITVEQIPTHWRIKIIESNGSTDFVGAIAELKLFDPEGSEITPASITGTPGASGSMEPGVVQDGDASTRWLVRISSNPLPILLEFQTAPATKVASYKIMPSPWVASGDTYRMRTPRSWIVETSLDGLNWEEAHSVTGIDKDQWYREQFNTYIIPE
jgi:hypothetical protein